MLPLRAAGAGVALFWCTPGLVRAASISMSTNLEKIGPNVVKKVPSMEEVKLETLWQDNTVVITFFRRQAAKELSLLTPLLEKHNVKNVGVGLEEFGLQDFVDGKYFNGDLYVDVGKKTYKDMGYKRYSTFGVIMTLFTKQARDAAAKNRSGEKIPYNLSGDGLQNGGTLVVTKGGAQILLDFRQDNPADHVENSEILKVLGITEEVPAAAESSASAS